MLIVKYRYQDLYLIKGRRGTLFSLTTDKELATKYKNYKYIKNKLIKNDLDLMFNIEEVEK